MHTQEQLGGVFEELHSELVPEDKVRLISKLKETSDPTLMVGDGMNDAPALAVPDVGVSIGLPGSAAAIETSHATLMSRNILLVPAVVGLGRRTRHTIAVNVASSMAAKATVLALAVAWRPVLWAAVLANVGTCLLVMLHNILLLGVLWTSRRSGKEEACRATVRSLVLRSQLFAAPNTASTSVQKPREESKSCSCCPKQNKSPEHSVVIDMPAPAVAGSLEEGGSIPRATKEGKIAGCCGVDESGGVPMVLAPHVICAAQELNAGEDDNNTNIKIACCDQGRTDCGYPQEIR